MEKYLFWGAFFFAYFINGITGFAGNIFAMPVGMSTIGHETSIAVLNCTGLLASIMIAATSFKHIVWREVVKMCSIMLVFMCVGAWINTIAPLDFLQKIYGVAILVIAARGLFFNKKNKLLPEWLLIVIVAIAGIIQGMFVSGGSFLAIYALQKLKTKEEFRATTTTVWTILNGTYGATELSKVIFRVMGGLFCWFASLCLFWLLGLGDVFKSASVKSNSSKQAIFCSSLLQWCFS